MSDFREGQLVRLKSGGPAMVVDNQYRLQGQGLVAVVWFVDGIPHRDGFHPLTLEAALSAQKK